jgi:hypothetical protein
VSALKVLEGRYPDCSPQNLAQEHDFELGIPTFEEPELPDLDYGQLQLDGDLSLTSLGLKYHDFRSLIGNSFKQTEEEVHVTGTSSSHRKKVLKVHEQFIQMLGTHEAKKAFANYDSTYGYQFYRIFKAQRVWLKETP